MIDLDQYDLIIFGDYNVTTNAPFKDHEPLHMLPGRAEYLVALQEDRSQRGISPLKFAVCGNKGGAAWGKHSEEEGEAELRQTAAWIGSTLYAVCFGCPKCAEGFERYTTPEMLARRKPSPVMFQELAEQACVPLKKVLIVDHYQDSYNAALALGCGWYAPNSFFAQAVQYIPVSREEIARELAQLTLPSVGTGALLDEDLDLFDIDAHYFGAQEGEE